MNIFQLTAFPQIQSTGMPLMGIAKPANQTDWLSATASQNGEVDLIHRTITNASTVISHTVWPSSQIQTQLSAWHQNLVADIDALVTVAAFQRKYINYQATYNAFLLGALTEEEFEQESDAYLVDERKAEPEKLAPVLARLDRLLPFKLSERELGEYLEVDQNSIKRAIAHIHAQQALEGVTGDHFSPQSPQLARPE